MNEILFSEQTLEKVLGLLETATVMGGAAAILYFLIPVIIAAIKFGTVAYVFKTVMEALKEVCKGSSFFEKKVELNIGRYTISDAEEDLYHQIMRVRGKRTGIDSSYIHECSVNWLKEAIDDKEIKDLAEKKR